MVEKRWEMVEKVKIFCSQRDPARPLSQPARPRATSFRTRATYRDLPRLTATSVQALCTHKAGRALAKGRTRFEVNGTPTHCPF